MKDYNSQQKETIISFCPLPYSWLGDPNVFFELSLLLISLFKDQMLSLAGEVQILCQWAEMVPGKFWGGLQQRKLEWWEQVDWRRKGRTGMFPWRQVRRGDFSKNVTGKGLTAKASSELVEVAELRAAVLCLLLLWNAFGLGQCAN